MTHKVEFKVQKNQCDNKRFLTNVKLYFYPYVEDIIHTRSAKPETHNNRVKISDFRFYYLDKKKGGFFQRFYKLMYLCFYANFLMFIFSYRGD